MLKSKKATAKPVEAVDHSSAELSARLIELRARHAAAEDRQSVLAGERDALLLKGAPDSELASRREEHLRLEIEITDLERAARLVEDEHGRALVRERRESMEARSAAIKAELLPSLADTYADLRAKCAALFEVAQRVRETEFEINGFNHQCTVAKRGDLRIANDARHHAAKTDVPFVRPVRMKDETADAYALRVGNAQAAHSRVPDLIRADIEALFPALLDIAYPGEMRRRRRLVDVRSHVDKVTGQAVETYLDVDAADRRPVMGSHGRPRAQFEGNVDKYPVHRGRAEGVA